jgi:mRNA-degrading endonuclease toxin of MazEF toxin-antitoxin module
MFGQFTLLGAVIAVSLVFSLCSASLPLPGKVQFWDASKKASLEETNVQVNSRSFTADSAARFLKDKAAQYEAVVVISSDNINKVGENVLSVPTVQSSIKLSQNAHLLSNVYHNAVDVAAAAETSNGNRGRAVVSHSLVNALLTAHSAAADTKKDAASPAEVLEQLRSNNALQNGRVDTFHVKLVPPSKTEKDSSLAALLGTANVLFVGVEESNEIVTAPTERGHYKRQLSESTAAATTTVASDSSFSIYYEGKYLYITPDIFTGLMTGLFMFFVALTGYNCMGGIQGMTSFYDKVPSNGKEA